jgi:hypothetical protein
VRDDFWSEECFNADSELKLPRDFMRQNASIVPVLMVDVDATKIQDWDYVDTAFAAPNGGKNYFETMRAFDPAFVLDQLKTWVRDFPVIRNWPSYVTLHDFYANYSRSGMWALLRSKARADFEEAQKQTAYDANGAFVLAENAAWISLAMLSVDAKDPEMTRLKNDIKTFLRQENTLWSQSPLRELMN